MLIRCIPSDKSCLMLNTDGLVRGLDKLGGVVVFSGLKMVTRLLVM